jgi:hypothetical protein
VKFAEDEWLPLMAGELMPQHVWRYVRIPTAGSGELFGELVGLRHWAGVTVVQIREVGADRIGLHMLVPDLTLKIVAHPVAPPTWARRRGGR